MGKSLLSQVLNDQHKTKSLFVLLAEKLGNKWIVSKKLPNEKFCGKVTAVVEAERASADYQAQREAVLERIANSTQSV